MDWGALLVSISPALIAAVVGIAGIWATMRTAQAQTNAAERAAKRAAYAEALTAAQRLLSTWLAFAANHVPPNVKGGILAPRLPKYADLDKGCNDVVHAAVVAASFGEEAVGRSASALLHATASMRSYLGGGLYIPEIQEAVTGSLREAVESLEKETIGFRFLDVAPIQGPVFRKTPPACRLDLDQGRGDVGSSS